MAIHIAYIRPTLIDQNNNVVDKNDPNTTIQQIYSNTETQMRVLSNPLIPNSYNHPTIEQYLILEDSIGFILRHLDNNMIITQI